MDHVDTELPGSAEALRIYRLIHELCEIGANTLVWRERLLTEMEQMVEAQISVSYLMHFSLDPNDIAPKMPVYVERGTNDHWRRYLQAGDVTGDPITPHIMKRFGTDFTVARNEFVDDATFWASDYWRDVAVPSEMHDVIYSQVAIEVPSVVDGLSVCRKPGNPRFTRRDVVLVRFVHQELARLWNRRDPVGVHTLPPRQREVLDGIRRGESRKAIAEKMGVSSHTVHTYERALFERAGVKSRGGLLARLSEVIRPNLLP